MLEFASKFLKSSSTGIEQLAFTSTRLTEDEFQSLLFDELIPEPNGISEGSSWEHPLPNGDVIRVQRNQGLEYARQRLQAAHKTSSGEITPLDLQQESDGTRRLLQLIPALHTLGHANLLDQDLLRRDEIWFAEKDSAGATSLYSLLDFKVRNDLEIRKHYLQGRFGAVPFLGGAARFAEKEGSSRREPTEPATSAAKPGSLSSSIPG